MDVQKYIDGGQREIERNIRGDVLKWPYRDGDRERYRD